MGMYGSQRKLYSICRVYYVRSQMRILRNFEACRELKASLHLAFL